MLGMCMSLRQSQSLSQRQELEQRLLQDLRITQVQRLELRQYICREDSFKRLYKKALANLSVYQYDRHDLKFEFACLKRAWLPGDLLEEGCCGFAHALYNPWDEFFYGKKIALARASWLLFAVPDFFVPVLMPEQVTHCVVVHEHGEEVTLGEHYLATKLEFAVSKLDGGIRKYVRWLEKNYPQKFADVFSHQTRIILPDSDEFQKELELKSKAEYAVRVRKMIEGFEWPYSTLQKLSRAKREGEKAQGLLFGAFTNTAMDMQSCSPFSTIQDAIAFMEEDLRQRLKAVRNTHLICLPNAQGAFKDGIRGMLQKAFLEWLHRRKDYLEVHGLFGQFAKELATLGTTSFPQTGVFSARVKEVIQAISK